MTENPYPRSDPRHQALNIRSMLDDAMKQVREEVHLVDDPRARALFETTAEVLQGLVNSYTHYEEGGEEAWKQGPPTGGRPPR